MDNKINGDRLNEYKKTFNYSPFYSDKSDYNTNAKSYYDYLARYNGFMSELIDFVNDLAFRIGKYNHGSFYVNIETLDVIEPIESRNTDMYNDKWYKIAYDNIYKINPNYILYFPSGNYVLEDELSNMCFGQDATIVLNNLEFNLSNEPQQINSVEQNRQRLNNFVTGINAGLNVNDDPKRSYGNTVIGSEAFKKGESQRRNTMVGQDAGKELITSYSNTAIGVGTLMESHIADRGTYIGGNAGKWAGANDNLVGGHQLYQENDINEALNLRFPNWRDYAGQWNAPKFKATKPEDNQSNVAIGRNAQGYNITTKRSVGVGYNAMEQTLNGDGVVAIGESALQYGLNAEYSTVIGGRAGYRTSETLQDTIVGKSACQNLVHSAYNTIMGYNALASIEGDWDDRKERNVAIGRNAMALSQGNSENNVAVGENALTETTNSNENVAIGHSALAGIGEGDENTFIGGNAGASLVGNNTSTGVGYNALNNEDLSGYSNITGLGQNSSVSGSNQVQLGNSSTTPYAFQALQVRSDRRDKTNINKTELGLEFIKKLKPVKYQLDIREDYEENGIDKDGSLVRQRHHQGFIAQDVKDISDEMGIDFAGVQHHEVNGGKDVYSLGYEEFIAPMTNAIQEQQKIIESMKEEITQLKKQIKNK